MKKTIYRLSSVLFSAAMLFLTACEKENNQEGQGGNDTPAFPELVTMNDIEPGSTLTLTIQPNEVWTLSIPVESYEWFKILDGKFKIQTINGGPLDEPKTITIWTTDEPSFALRSCEVKLKVGDETRTIAEYTLAAADRVVEVYPVSVNENGRFEYVDGSYVFESEPLEDSDVIEMVWDENERRYTFPIEVKSNYEWTVEWPEWSRADVSVDTRIGDVPVEIYSVSSKLPLEDAEGEIKFKHGDQVKKTVKVRIPGSKDRFVHNLSGYTSLSFDHACYFHSESGAYSKDPVQGYMYGPKDSRIVVLEMGEGGYVEAESPWLDVTVSSWDDLQGADVLQSRSVSITVPRYAGSEERKAMILFLSATAPSDINELLSSDRMNVKDEYKSFAVPVVQAGRPSEYITFEADESEREFAGLIFARSESALLPDLNLEFATGSEDWQYDLSYIKEMASAKSTFYITESYETVTVLDADGNVVNTTENWLAYSPLGEGLYGQIVMDMEKFVSGAPSEIDGYVVFKDETGKVLSIVHCFYKEEPKTPEDVLEDVSSQFFMSHLDATIAGATIHQVISGPTYEAFKEHQAPIYIVKFTSDNTSLEIRTSEECKIYSCVGKKDGPEMVTIDDQMFIDKELYQKIEDYNNGLIDKYPDTSEDRSTMGILTFGKTSQEDRTYPGYSKFNMKMPAGVSENVMTETIQFATTEKILFVFVCQLDLR